MFGHTAFTILLYKRKSHRELRIESKVSRMCVIVLSFAIGESLLP